MNTTRNRTLLAFGVALALAAGSASATNGYYTHGVGTKMRAQAGAGSANPEELLVLATNPAGIAFVGDSIDAGLGFFSPMRDYKTTASQAPGACFGPGQCLLSIGPNNLSSKNELFFVPYVGAKWTLSEQDHLALAFYGRGGMNTKWEGGTVTYDPYFGMNPSVTEPVTLPGTFGDNTAGVDLMQGFLNLSYARKFTDSFSGGVSAIFAFQRFEARGVSNFDKFTKTFMQSGGTVMPKHLSDNGHDLSYGYGASVGFQWTPVDMFSLAAAYTTKMSMSDFSDYSDLFAGGGAFDMPSTWTVGIALRPTDGLALMFDVQEIRYSDVDAVANGIDGLTSGACQVDIEYCLGGKKGAGFGWEDMTVYKLGAAWDVSDDWTVRFGYSTTDQPIPKDQMTFNILAPGVMEEHWTVGFSHDRPSGNQWNVSFMYAPEKTISGPQNFDPTQTVELSMKQYELEIGYSWK
jgi:long-chain fatty acid transport protein